MSPEANLFVQHPALRITARTDMPSLADYVAAERTGVETKVAFIKGDGSPAAPFQGELTITNRLAEPWRGVIKVELAQDDEADEARFFLPGFLYGRNGGDRERHPDAKWWPRLKKDRAAIPDSPYWMTRADRLSHPLALMHLKGIIYGISASPYRIMTEHGGEQFWLPGMEGELTQYNGFCCSIEEGAAVGFTIGYENAPVLYIHEKEVVERKPLGDNAYTLAPGATATFAFQAYAFDSEDANGLYSVVEDVYWRYHERPRPGAAVMTAVTDIAEAIYGDAYVPLMHNYALTVGMNDDPVRQASMGCLSWTGGVETAAALLLAGLRLERQEMVQQAAECIHHIVASSLNLKTGLPFDAYMNGEWTTKGWWDGHLAQSGHSSYLVGQAVYYILKAYDYERSIGGRTRKEWLDFGAAVLRSVDGTENEHGEYPYLWSADTGEGIEYDSFAGAWCLAAGLYQIKLTGNRARLSAYQESEEHYYQTYVRRAECYGAPLDTWKSADSEGILAYIKATKMLHELTGQTKYLHRLRAGLDYEFSYKFGYNPPILVRPLSELKWSCSGGTITSVCNPHIHPMSNNMLDELLYYTGQTHDEYVHSRLRDTLEWGLQAYNRYDGELDYGKKGWMSERYCHSEGLLIERYPDGSPSSVWFTFLPWGAANVLEGMCGAMWPTLHNLEEDER